MGSGGGTLLSYSSPEAPEAFAERLISATDSHAAPLESSAQQSIAKPAPNGVSTLEALVQAG
jgi:hypothetical protein